MSCKITQEHLEDLLGIFEKKAYEPGSCEPGTIEHDITKKCQDLFMLDYNVIILDNQNGALSPNYPSRILIPEYENNSNGGTNYFTATTTLSGTLIQQQQYLNQYHHQQQQQQHNKNKNLCDTKKSRDLIMMAKYARCRQRFVIPAILYKDKFICRSATISVMPETYGRKVVDYAYDCINGTNNSSASTPTTAGTSVAAAAAAAAATTATTIAATSSKIDEDKDEDECHDILEDTLMPQSETSPFSYHEVIKSDKQLLKTFSVTNIIDLMVEQRKMKYFVPVSSSEKADPENQYKEFNIFSLPYPGCEFFSKFRDNNYMSKNLHYNWKQSFVDATLKMPKNFDIDDDINWNDYKKWDVVLMTQNYLKSILKCIQDDDSDSGGILVHCISGWDRTPLFISLIRLSLWADGLIHQSLNPIQIAYLTLAYDWYLFGHQLPDRLTRGEEILFFCFHVLKHITDDEFCILDQRYRKRTKTSSSSGSSIVILKSDCCDEELISSREDCISVQNFDQDSSDSFSNLEMSSNENFSLTNRSPNSKRSKTSPISVPGASACRERNSSSSSTSNGSWQVVTETGSIDSIMNNNPNNGATSSTSRQNLLKSFSTLRKQRLNAVRAAFIQSYGKTIGLKFKEGSTINLATFIGTIAEQLF